MTSRAAVINSTIDRAAITRKDVYGFSRHEASCQLLAKKMKVPENWTHICVEGDKIWTRIPDDDEEIF